MKNVITFTIILIIFVTGLLLKLAFAGGKNMDMLADLRIVENSETWKQIWCDGYSIYIYTLPFCKNEKKLFEVENRKFMQIGTRLLSPDNKKVAFSLGVYKNLYYTDLISQDLYLIDTDGANLRKLKLDSSKNIFLIAFVGNNKLLFSGYGVEKEEYLSILDLNTDITETLYELVKSTVRKWNVAVSNRGDLLVYDTGNGFIVYNIQNKTSKKIRVEGDRPILSPDSQHILFRRDSMTGSYFIIGIDGLNESLILSDQKIQTLLYGSGDYRDLNFVSWSHDSKFILLSESSDLQKGRMFVLEIYTGEIIEIKS